MLMLQTCHQIIACCDVSRADAFEVYCGVRIRLVLQRMQFTKVLYF
jgi:hypothetical protein